MKKIAGGLLAFGKAVAASVPAFVRDMLGLAGAGLIAYGFYLINPPYGYIAGGVLLLLGSILSAFSQLAPAKQAN
jgi:hypothetical protein